MGTYEMLPDISDPEWQKAHMEMGFYSPIGELYKELGIIPKTNGDRIRGMSDYEMAEWIADILNHCDNKTPEEECLESCPLYACCNLPFDNIENWLKSPAEEADE